MEVKHVTVVVMSATKNSPELHAESGAEYPANIWVGIRPLWFHNVRNIHSNLQRQGITSSFLVVTPESSSQALHLPLLDKKTGPYVRQLAIDSQSFQDTYSQVYEHLSKIEPIGPIVFLAGDTLLPADSVLFNETSLRNRLSLLAIDPKDLPFDSALSVSDRWTRFLINSRTHERWVHDRVSTTKEFPDTREVVYSGACSFRDLDALRKFVHLFSSVTSNFFVELLKFHGSEIVEETDRRPFYDFGHLDFYWINRFCHLSAREFNSIRFDSSTATLIKTSSSPTFESQAQWFEDAEYYAEHFPQFRDLTYHIPETRLSFSPQVEVEMVAEPVHSLAELVHQGMSTYMWKIAADRVARTFMTLMRCTADSSVMRKALTSEEIQQRCRRMYYTKTLDRLRQLDLPSLGLPPRWEGRGYDMETIEESVSELYNNHIAPFLADVPVSFVHGDFCLSNILFDKRNTRLLLIDPRGSFEPETPDVLPSFGDPAYDLAKFYHSTKGNYDLILSGDLEYSPSSDFTKVYSDQGRGKFKVLERLNSSVVALLSERVQEMGVDWKSLTERASNITPLLFLSMVPLHSEDSRRQRSLLMRGMQLLVTRLKISTSGDHHG